MIFLHLFIDNFSDNFVFLSFSLLKIMERKKRRRW